MQICEVYATISFRSRELDLPASEKYIHSFVCEGLWVWGFLLVSDWGVRKVGVGDRSLWVGSDGLAWNFHNGGFKFETPCQRQQGIGFSGRALRTGIAYCGVPLMCGLQTIVQEQVLPCAHPKGSGWEYP